MQRACALPFTECHAAIAKRRAAKEFAYDVRFSCFPFIIVSVRCTGDSRLLEQVGEKREFECALSARGLPHEEFELHVRRIRRRPFGEAWSCDYAITVSRTDGGVRHVYAGGPAYRWVERFAEHLADGKYGLGARVTGLLMARRRARGNGRRSFAHTE